MQTEFTKPSILLCAKSEQIPHAGEDAFSQSFTREGPGYIAAYDGCGGMGAKTYEKAGEKTGARIAARLAAFLTDQFYHEEGFLLDGSDAQRLCEKLSAGFSRIRKGIDVPGGFRIGGNMFRELPTTMSLIAAGGVPEKQSVLCEYIWAGDSRGFFLDGKGICQITEDDLDTKEDAFSNLRNDAKISNIINAETPFELHEKRVQLFDPVMLITATDGAFGYFNTPMEFEYVILDTMMRAKTVTEWQTSLRETLDGYTGDDMTILIAVYGAETLARCKEIYAERFRSLYRIYIAPLEQADEEQMRQLWEQYKADYYRG